MKIVWLLNGTLPSIKEKEKLPGGSVTWTVTLADLLSQREDIELTIFFPQHKTKNVIRGSVDNIRYMGFYEPPIAETKYNEKLEKLFRRELADVNPDIVHIWGTEFIHTLCMVNAFNNPRKTVVSIQGLISVIGDKYCEGLPEKVVRRYTFRDFIRRDRILDQKQKFLKRGKYEIEALKKTGHAIGRTEWDKKTVLDINPKLKYHYGRELLRPEFYTSRKWDYKKCEKHSIFMSQAYYPIKGMHYAVGILQLLKEKYPDVKLYVTGKDVFPSGIKEKLKQDSYSEYIRSLIEKYDLRNNIEYLGSLSETQMIEQYLNANVFLQASIMENSPNSLGEAMILGVPCVASNVGGTTSIIRNNIDGYTYRFDMIRDASDRIKSFFENKDNAFQVEERNRALQLYNIENGDEEYIGVYHQLLG